MKNIFMIIIMFVAVQLFAVEEAVNLVPDLLKGKGKLQREKTSTKDVQISIDNKILKVSMPDKNSILYLRSPGVEIRPGKKYLLSLDIKVTDLKFLNSKSYLIFYIYNTSNNAHGWFRVVGSGSMDWFTILLPFESDNILKNGKARPNILLRFLRLSGEFEIKNINVSEIPLNSDLKRGIINAAGKNIVGPTLRLKQ